MFSSGEEGEPGEVAEGLWARRTQALSNRTLGARGPGDSGPVVPATPSQEQVQTHPDGHFETLGAVLLCRECP